MKKFLAILLTVVLTAAVAITGTVAYLQDTDGDVNTMTFGNVYIEQIEEEIDNNGNRVPFTQDKPLYPYTGELGWKYEPGYEHWRKFNIMNAVDKYVTVKNTGESEAYVRTLIAFEMGSATYDEYFKLIGQSINSFEGGEFSFPDTWKWEEIEVIEIGGKNYNLMAATHLNPIEPDKTTIPSLLQVYLNKTATNEDCKKLDGNGNGKYDILVLSQAVQVEGFPTPFNAFENAFCKITEENSELIADWFEEMLAENGNSGSSSSDYSSNGTNH